MSVAIVAACVGLAAAEWSCDDCDRAISELSAFSVGEAAMNLQVDNIVNNYCPGSANAENCASFVPDFWKLIAKDLWPEAWSHLCDDMETCDNGHQLSCDECKLRVDWSLEYMRDPVVEGYWVRKLETGTFCSDNYSGLEEVCKGHVKDVFPKVMYMMAENYWVPNFCEDFGCKA